MENPTVKYTVQRLERCVEATFAFGEDSFTAPYYSIYFIANNSGIVAISDKSLPTGEKRPDGSEVYIDSMQQAAMEFRGGVNKYEVLQTIYDELGRIGEKLQREGRPLQDSDISKLMTKLGSLYKAQ